jgi:polyhydroxyalkanoate synthesis repressor PhaR
MTRITVQKIKSDSLAPQRRAKATAAGPAAVAAAAAPLKRASTPKSGRPAKPKVAAAQPHASAGTSPDASAAAKTAEQALRIIKKYPNRRLYDTTTSSYITLTDVRALVMSRLPFAVRDAKTNEDLTRAILLQIILEEEAGGAPMFTEQVLANIIRFYGNAMQGFMGTYLEKNVQTLMELQSKLTEQSKGLSPEVWAQFLNQQSPLVHGAMGSYLEQSKQLFTQMQDQLQKQSTQMLSGFGLKL